MIWFLACTEPSVEQSPLELNLVRHRQVTFESAEALGPHRLRSVRKQSSTERTLEQRVQSLLIDGQIGTIVIHPDGQ